MPGSLERERKSRLSWYSERSCMEECRDSERISELVGVGIVFAEAEIEVDERE